MVIKLVKLEGLGPTDLINYKIPNNFKVIETITLK